MAALLEALRRCQNCKFEVEESTPITECPMCHTKLVFVKVSQDVTVMLNWHHFRCITHWAQRYVHLHCKGDEDVEETLKVIMAQLTTARPEKAAALTVKEELQEFATSSQTEVIYADGPEPEIIKPEKVH